MLAALLHGEPGAVPHPPPLFAHSPPKWNFGELCAKNASTRYNSTMFGAIYHTIIYDPMYNGLIFLIEHIPSADVGIAVIILTILVRLILFPLSLKAIRTQFTMKKLEPELERLKEQYKSSREELARHTMELYRQHRVNPLSSFFFLIIQIFFIFGLYAVFIYGKLPDIRTELLYSFIPTPEVVNMHFLGLIDMAGKSVVLALLAGVTQFIQTRIAMPSLPQKKAGSKPSFKDDLMRSFHFQARYAMPLLILFIAYTFSAAVALYFTVSNIVSIGQELYVRRARAAEVPKT